MHDPLAKALDRRSRIQLEICGVIADPENEAKFLETIRGKDIYELGRMARLLVIDERFRMIPL